MVLEETLLFDSSEGADAFIKYLRKKGCKAHKDTVASFLEDEELEGTIDNLIAFLNFLVERDNPGRDEEDEEDEERDFPGERGEDEAGDIAEERGEEKATGGAGRGGEEERDDSDDEGDEDEEWDWDRDEERGERDSEWDWDPEEAYTRVNRANRREKLKEGRARVAEILETHNEGDVIYTEEDLEKHREVFMESMVQRVFPIMQKNLSEMGIDLPDREEEPGVSPEQAKESDSFLFVSGILEENELVQKDEGGNYRLARKVPAGHAG